MDAMRLVACVVFVLTLAVAAEAQPPQPSTPPLEAAPISKDINSERERQRQADLDRLKGRLNAIRRELWNQRPLFCEKFEDGQWIRTPCYSESD